MIAHSNLLLSKSIRLQISIVFLHYDKDQVIYSLVQESGIEGHQNLNDKNFLPNTSWSDLSLAFW